ncbi:MAG: hypothetical protein IJD86_00060, partial [Clostridia bacterium]|nr:hypothetical protein [Clostridia bacterium]
MKIGFGSYTLTPPLGIELTGYGYYLERKALSVRDDLYARAVSIEDGDNKLLIASLDVLGINKDIVSDVVLEMEKYGYSRSNMIFVSV